MRPVTLILPMLLASLAEAKEISITSMREQDAYFTQLCEEKGHKTQDTVTQQLDKVPAILLAPEEPTSSHKSLSLLSVKTNIIPWTASIMNLGVGIGLSPNISVTLPVWYCPWFISEKTALRILFLQPEARWWFSTPGKGHFVGIHGSLAWFNMKFNKYRYQDRGRPLAGAGLTYGYSLKIHDNWGIEFSLGAGYMNMRYDRFYNVINGQLHDTRITSYFGIDHLAVSFVYYLPLHKL